MQIREYSLPPGWFPRDPKEVAWTISDYLEDFTLPDVPFCACISPHAGWYYSGRLAAIGIASLSKDIQTVVVIGGHLPADYPALMAMEDSARTPLGELKIDKDMRSLFIDDMKKMGYNTAPDRDRDNTVEVLLPMVKYLIPKANVLWLRLAASADSFIAGKILSKTAKKAGKNIAVIGSTDLTHYGVNYNFSPYGTGENALRRVREVNDASFIRAVENGNEDEVLLRSRKDFSSCSVGAVLGAMGFANAEGCKFARLLGYGTSADKEKGSVPDSFVGYAAMGFVKPA